MNDTIFDHTSVFDESIQTWINPPCPLAQSRGFGSTSSQIGFCLLSHVRTLQYLLYMYINKHLTQTYNWLIIYIYRCVCIEKHTYRSISSLDRHTLPHLLLGPPEKRWKEQPSNGETTPSIMKSHAICISCLSGIYALTATIASTSPLARPRHQRRHDKSVHNLKAPWHLHKGSRANLNRPLLLFLAGCSQLQRKCVWWDPWRFEDLASNSQ